MTPYRRARRSSIVLILGAMAVATAATAAAQDRPMSASLLKRLGEAVDGNRTGQEMFIVASYRFPHRVLGVFPTQGEADLARTAQGGEDIGVFGPLIAPPDSVVLPIPVPFDTLGLPDILGGRRPGCVHDQITSMMGIAAICPAPLEIIDSIEVRVWPRGGAVRTNTFPGRSVDALFFSVPAFDKFVVPYYTGVLGVRYAARLRDVFLGRPR